MHKMTSLLGFDFFLEQTTRNLIFRRSIFPVAQIMRLDELVHHAAFGYIQLEKIALIQFGGWNKSIFLKNQAVDGKILTKRTPVDPAVGKNKIIIGHPGGPFKFFIRV
jgi:hypothetical protein